MKILMVCLGNICRSPLAEGILVSKVNNGIMVDSAGTAAYHIGEIPDDRSIKIAKNYGIDITYQRARQFTKKDFEVFDLILAMDNSNYNNICQLAKSEADLNKVKRILDEVYPGENREVPDPYYGGENGFENVFQILDEATNALLCNLEKNG